MTTFGLYGARLSLAVWRHLTCYIFFVFTYYFVLSLKNKYTILLYYTYRQTHEIGHGNGWILLSDSDQSEESNGWILLSDSDQSEESNGWILLSDSDQSEESNGWILLSDSDQSERSSHARYRWYKRHCAFISPHFLL